MSDPKDAPKPLEKPQERRAPGAKEYDRITDFLATLKAEGGEVFPLTTVRLRQLLGDEGYATVVNYERAEAGKDKLEGAEALEARAKLFERVEFK